MQGHNQARVPTVESSRDLKDALGRIEGAHKEYDEIVKTSYAALRQSIEELAGASKRPLAAVIVELVRPWERELKLSQIFAVPANYRGSKGTPKYRHPLDPNVTWSGAGKRPAWFVAYRNLGGNVEDLAICTRTGALSPR